MRLHLVLMAFVFFSFFAWKDWFKSVCFLIVTLAILENPENMPKEMFGVTGANPWNLLLLSCIGAVIFDSRNRRETLMNSYALPPRIKFLIAWFIFVVIVATIRKFINFEQMQDYGMSMLSYEVRIPRPAPLNLTKKDIVIDDIINTFKFILPAFLVYYGATNRKNINVLVLAIIAMGFLLAVQVIKEMPISALTDGKMLEQTAKRKIDDEIGYYRSDIAILFAGIAWCLLFARPIIKSKWFSMGCVVASFMTLLAMGLTGGRIGIAACVVAGMVIAWFKMRSLLIIGPIMAVLLVSFVPAVQERVMQGFGDSETGAEVDESSLTSGRADIWPLVIEKIADAPLVGYGRNAIQATGVTLEINQTMRITFLHPHNAYLELLIDNGFLMALPIFFFFFILLKYSFSLFRDKRNDIYQLIGGVSFVLLLTQMVGFVGNQHFYFMSSQIPMWCSLAAMLRVYYKRKQLEDANASIEEHRALYSEKIVKKKII